MELWAPKDHPSAEQAVCINHVIEQNQNQHQHNEEDDDKDGWEDIEDDDE